MTVDFIGESNIEEYARTLFNKWGIGDKDKNNGVLLLMVIGAENYWCQQGSGLESQLPTPPTPVMKIPPALSPRGTAI